MRQTLTYLKGRLLEASTWAGFAALFLAGAPFISTLVYGSVICGAIAVLMPDFKVQAT